MRPLHFAEAVRHTCRGILGTVNDDGNQERHVLSHVPGALDGQPPLTAEVAFLTSVRVRRDHGHEESALVDLLAYLPIPGVPSAKLALVEPYVDCGGAERVSNTLCRSCILGGVAQEDRARGGRHQCARYLSGPAGHVRPATSAGVGRPTFRQNAVRRGSSL